MEREQANHAVTRVCRLLEVSASGYCAWRRRGESARAQSDAALLARIQVIHKESRGTYGAPRVHAELRLGWGIGGARKRVARRLRRAGLSGVQRRQLPGCTMRNADRQLPPDRVEREFAPPGPDRLGVADLTPHPTDAGWLFLATVVDAYSRQVVGWALARPAPRPLRWSPRSPWSSGTVAPTEE